MAKFHMFWKLAETKIPLDVKERAGGWGLLMNMVKQEMEKGVLTQWGAFTSEGRGYCVAEGTNVEVAMMTERFVPYVQFETKPVSSAEEIIDLIEHLAAGQ